MASALVADSSSGTVLLSLSSSHIPNQQAITDIPRLSLSVDRPPSASPFPSPGSPFLPPPSLGPHEFASKPLPTAQVMQAMRHNIDTKSKSPTLSTQADALAAPLSPGGDGGITPTVNAPNRSLAAAMSPITPRPMHSFQIPHQPQQQPQPQPPPQPQTPPPQQPQPSTPTSESYSLSDPRRVSIASSRPAPPSPAGSRRASAALSRHSSVRSRRQSRASTLSQQIDHDKIPSSSSAATVTQESIAPKRRSWLVKIRDFAFASSDDRHAGRGPDVPKPNRVRQRWSTMSTSSTSSSRHSDIDEEDDEERHASWSPFRWNTLSNHFSWASKPHAEDGAGPSRTDFERNFDVSSPVDETEDKPYDDDDDGDYDEEYPNEDEPLVPGLYRALYSFDPEGTAEMALEEDQVVRVVGRGGGVGWAIVEQSDGGHALVPESYLELVKTDEA